MDAASTPIDLKGLGLKGLFRKDGVAYRMIPEVIEALPAFYRAAATDVWRVLMKRVRKWGDLDEQLITRDIAEAIRVKQLEPGDDGYDADHRSESHAYKGLFALEKLCGLILRIRARGRRVIRFVKGLLGQERDEKKKKNDGDALVDVVSLFSPSSEGVQGEAAAAATEDLPADLAGAVGLLPDLSRERLVGWTRMFGAELAGKGVAWLRAWLLHPRSELRPRLSHWVEKALLGWRKRLDCGELAMADIDAMIAVKARKWGKVAAAPAKPPEIPPPAAVRPMTAEEVSDLVDQARRPRGGQMARLALRQGVEDGTISPGLAATIPPELVRRE